MIFSPFSVPIIAIIMAGLYPLFRAYAKKIERGAQPGMSGEVELRLDRIERAVEAVAIEVERISEGQRFTTKLLSDNSRNDQKVAPQREPVAGQPS
jgi:hypothetical protein